MAQQINLFSPILLAPKRYFSARAMLRSLLVFALLLAATGAWMIGNSSTLRRDLQSSLQAQSAERARLTQALAAPAATSGPALAQELTQAEQTLAARRALLDELSRGRLVAGRSHAAVLRMVAQTVPASVWLTDVRLVAGRLDLSGKTLQPEALRPWLVQLAQHPVTAGQQLAAVKLERVVAAAGSEASAAAGEQWTFQLVSQVPAVATESATTGGRP